MNVTVLMENTACGKALSCEHGLSLYIETGGKRILFDAGQTAAFADNAEKLGVDLSKVDFAVLSHGHYDHGGGLTRFLERNSHAPVYVHADAFGAHYNGSEKYIGLDPGLKDSGRLIFTSGRLEIAPGITLVDGAKVPTLFPAESFGLNRMEEGVLRSDDFRHEQYLLIEEKGRTVCFSGCSHRGILNISRCFQPDVLIGGFHFMKLNPEGDGAQILRHAAEELLSLPTTYYTGHCTGAAQYDFLKQIMGNRLHCLSAGTVLRI